MAFARIKTQRYPRVIIIEEPQRVHYLLLFAWNECHIPCSFWAGIKADREGRDLTCPTIKKGPWRINPAKIILCDAHVLQIEYTLIIQYRSECQKNRHHIRISDRYPGHQKEGELF